MIDFIRFLLSLFAVWGITVLALQPSEAEAGSLVLGGWSKHGQQDNYDRLNERHNAVGFILDNGFTMVTFNNSFYRQSTVIGYNKPLSSWSRNDFEVSTSITLGVVTGYTKAQAKGSYIGEGVSVYLLPVVTLGYKQFKVDTGLSIAFDQPLITHNLRYSF